VDNWYLTWFHAVVSASLPVQPHSVGRMDLDVGTLWGRRLFSLAGLPLRISNAHTINPASKIGVIDLGPGVVCFTCALSVYTLQSLREPVNRALLRIADHIEA
jgi:hypothetical protein